MGRKTKWAIGISCGLFVVLAVYLILYFVIWDKDVRKITSLDHTTYKASEFKQSEMRLFGPGTFHIKIIRGKNELFFLGIGTYKRDGNKYIFTFVTAIGSRTDEGIIDVLDDMKDRPPSTVSGSRIKFSDHNGQIYYFG